jgi:hypothetical protein
MSLPRSPRNLQLPNPALVTSHRVGRPVRRRRRISRLRQVLMGLLLVAAGIALLLALLQLPSQLDTVLLVSTAIANLIKGLTHIGLGLLQLAGVLVVALVALMALVLLGAGLSRLIRALAPAAPSKGPGPGGPRRAAPSLDPQPLPPQFEGDPSLQWLQSLRDGDGGPPFR